MMGTAKYLSPEQVRGKQLDGRADLYSLGLVLYECLAGRVPFLGQTDADTALARLQRDPTDLTRLRPTLPHGLAAADPQAARPQPRRPPGHGRRAPRPADAHRQRRRRPHHDDDPAEGGPGRADGAAASRRAAPAGDSCHAAPGHSAPDQRTAAARAHERTKATYC